MAGATVFIPFNYQPTSTAINQDSYTVPVGKYALVTINMWAKAEADLSDLTSYTGFPDSNSYKTVNDFQKESCSFWLTAGDAITKSASNATGDLTFLSSDNARHIQSENSETSVVVSLNANALMSLKANANAQIFLNHNGVVADTILANFSGDHGVHIHAAEYTII